MNPVSAWTLLPLVVLCLIAAARALLVRDVGYTASRKQRRAWRRERRLAGWVR